MNGSIYWDESSRGYHGNAGHTPYTRGRWVGERTVNGKRIRMRSRDYDKVVAWMNGTKAERKGLLLKGLPCYSVDVERREVYGKNGQVMTGRKMRNSVVYRISRDNVRHAVTWNRLAYAALHGIDVMKIPKDIVVDYRDGDYVLTYQGDKTRAIHAEHAAQRRRVIMDTLDHRKREIDILKRYYNTKNTQELVTYATQECFNGMVLHVMKRRKCQMQRAVDVVMEATERFLQRVISEDVPVISISSTISSLCHQMLKEQRKKREYNDNIKIFER